MGNIMKWIGSIIAAIMFIGLLGSMGVAALGFGAILVILFVIVTIVVVIKQAWDDHEE